MSEWWTYRLGSFLMFSDATWGRLVASYNRDLWPAQLPALCLGLVASALALRARVPRHDRLVSAVLASAWIWVGWAFLHRRFASVNWPADYLGLAFVLQGAAIGWLGAVQGGLRFGRTAGPVVEPDAVRGRIGGLALALAGLAAVPLVAPLLGRPWARMEVFGLMPDPTAIATLGILLMARSAPGWLSVIPVLACAASAATLWALRAPEAWVPAAGAAVAVSLLAVRRMTRPQRRPDGSA